MSDNLPLTHEPLSIIEARILGCLCEKEATTPDYYPLSLNALTNACNQKSNRYPILELDEEDITIGVDSLRAKRLTHVVSQAVSRVPKYKHSLDTVYPLTSQQRAILTELLLRGPQTAGELRTRCERMASFGSLESLKKELVEMAETSHPIIRELPRQPGKKDPRVTHLLSGEPNLETPAEPTAPVQVKVAVALPEEAETRIAQLEATVAKQAEEIQALRSDLDTFRAQFE